MEDLAKEAEAEAAAEECRQWDGQAIAEARDFTERRQTECAALDADERPAPATAEVITYHQSPGVVLRLVCACGAVHGGYVAVRARGLRGQAPHPEGTTAPCAVTRPPFSSPLARTRRIVLCSGRCTRSYARSAMAPSQVGIGRASLQGVTMSVTMWRRAHTVCRGWNAPRHRPQ